MQRQELEMCRISKFPTYLVRNPYDVTKSAQNRPAVGNSMGSHAAQRDGIFRANLVTAETPYTPRIRHRRHPAIDVHGVLGANLRTRAAGSALVRDHGASGGRFLAA